MNINVEKKPKSTLELTITVPQDKVKEAYEELFKQLVDTAEIKGFRKGQAPADLVKEKTDISKLYGEVINKLLQTYYPQALKEKHILPVANPQVEIKEFDLEKDFEFVATVAVRPEIKIGDYKKEIQKIYDEKTKEVKEINAERLKAGEPISHDHAHLSADDVVEGLVNSSEMELADLVVDDETDRLMSRLVDQAQAIVNSRVDFGFFSTFMFI